MYPPDDDGARQAREDERMDSFEYEHDGGYSEEDGFDMSEFGEGEPPGFKGRNEILAEESGESPYPDPPGTDLSPDELLDRISDPDSSFR